MFYFLALKLLFKPIFKCPKYEDKSAAGRSEESSFLRVLKGPTPQTPMEDEDFAPGGGEKPFLSARCSVIPNEGSLSLGSPDASRLLK